MSRVLPFVLMFAVAPGCAAHHIAALEDEIAVKDHTITALDEVNRGYLIQIGTLTEEIDHLGRKNKELAALYSALTDVYGPQIEGGNAALVVFPDRTTIVIGEQLSFESASATVSKDSGPALDELAAFLKAHPTRRFQVEGHTDAEPIHTALYASNWDLGAARALTVVKALVDRGVPASQLSAASFGATEPLAANSRADGMAMNRRIAVSVETSVAESGAQEALVEAARRHGGPVYAQTQPVDTSRVADIGPE